ncbi:MAG: c-type cytochrome [Caldilineaceae bacterium]|nr:c-type cytochrome [Caldilineaceae bacterium]
MMKPKSTWQWIGLIGGGLIALLVVAFVVLYGIGTARANQHYDISVTVPTIPNDAAAIVRGEHIANSFGICKNCHGEDLGGRLEFDIPGLLTIPTPNLTAGKGGVGAYYTDADWVRAIRHGVGHDGRPLFFMLSQAFNEWSDADVGALIAYLKQIPPVDNELPARNFAALGRVMMGTGMVPPVAVDLIDHTAPPPAAPDPGETAAYGAYLTHTCTECHGTQFNGKPFGPPGEEVPSPNLTPGGELATWSEAQFIQTLRSGVTPRGKALSLDMPWVSYGRMSDEELKAVWLYLQSLPALPQGG